MKKGFVISSVALAASLTSVPAFTMDIMARVISSTPVVQQIAVPRQVCSNQAVITQAPRSGAGGLLGALAGGAVGNSIGNGGGRAAATVIGLVGGAMLGDRIEGSNNQVQNVQQCSTQTFYENRPSHYNVVYEYSGTQYNTQMLNDPGPYVRLQVTPVGAVTPSGQPVFPNPQQVYPPQTYPPQTFTPQTYQPQVYVQPLQAPPGYIQQSTTYVQPVMVVPEAYPSYIAYPAYYSRPYARPSYYAPYSQPVGVSLNFGYSRGFGGHHHYRR